jgi:hypothetical protein
MRVNIRDWSHLVLFLIPDGSVPSDSGQVSDADELNRLV